MGQNSVTLSSQGQAHDKGLPFACICVPEQLRP